MFHNLFKRKLSIIILILSLFFVITPINSEEKLIQNLKNSGSVYYVSLTGSNSNLGTSDSPWRTPSYGASQLNPGDTLILLSGTYTLTTNIDFMTSGHENAPITMMGINAILDGTNLPNDYDNRDLIFIDNADFIIIDSIQVYNAPRAGIRLSYSDNIIIKNSIFGNNAKWGIFTDYSDYTFIDKCVAYGSGLEHGIYLSNSGDYPTVRGSTFYNNQLSGLQLNADPAMPGGDGIITGALIENNIIYNNGPGGAAGINLASVRYTTIRNNLLYNNLAGGIAMWDDGNPGTTYGCKNNIIVNNIVIFETGVGRSTLQMIEGSTNNTVYNNILIVGDYGDYPLELDSSTIDNATIDFNIYYHREGGKVVGGDDISDYSLSSWRAYSSNDDNSFLEFPENLFISIENDNYYYLDSCSAIDSGTSLEAPLCDIEGYSRPYGNGYDIGAYEFQPRNNQNDGLPFDPIILGHIIFAISTIMISLIVIKRKFREVR